MYFSVKKMEFLARSGTILGKHLCVLTVEGTSIRMSSDCARRQRENGERNAHSTRKNTIEFRVRERYAMFTETLLCDP
jgi:hypothetical protein